MNLNLKDKNALVCGSSQGIGKAVAIELALLGANVTLVARHEDVLKQTLNELDKKQNQHHDYLIADFSKPDELKKLIQTKTATTTYHILVNNTGGPPSGNIIDATEEQFLQAFQSHLICNHILATALVSGMKQAGYGRIINMISTSVKIPLRGLGVSNTIRAAVANWSKTMASELAPFGITVNNVLPGATNTQRITQLYKAKSEKTGKSIAELEKDSLKEIPMNRIGEPSEVAAAAAFLATPAASYITGINVPVDGGRTGCL
jgi:3-oxoacyl-[acyl-carrier protein] reductase